MSGREGTLDQALRAAIDSALDPERLGALVEERVSEAVAEWVDSALRSWGVGSPRQLMEDKVRGLLAPGIERLDLSNARVDLMLSSLLEESVVGERRALLGKYAELAKAEPKANSVVGADEILGRYSRFCAAEYDCAGREVFFDDEPSFGWLECRGELEAGDGRPWSGYEDATLALTLLDLEDDREREFNREVRLWRSKDMARKGEPWHVETRVLEVTSLRDMSDFDVYLARLALCHVRVACDPPWRETVEVEPEARPECEWS